MKATAAEPTTANRPVTAAGGGVRILVIDDDPSICEYLQALLTKDGMQATTCQDPETGLDLLRKERFHLLILDLMMPKLDGISVLEEIRRIDRELAVVIYTGYPSIDTAVKSLKHEVADYLQKPLSVAEFRETIRRVLRKKGLLLDPEEALHRRIGHRIRGRRREMGLTLKQLAHRSQVSVSMLSMIERAESIASVSTLYKVAAALEMRLQEFFADEEPS